MKESIRKNWYIYLAALVLGAQFMVFIIYRENSYIQVHDNLDLFVAHYQMIKANNAWFGGNVSLPMLHGISRDLLGSEFLLYNVLYIIFPPFVAYMLGYGLKTAIGIFGFNLLFKDIYGERYVEYRPVVVLCSLGYGLIPVFPTYGIAFTSVPIIIYLVRKLYFTKNRVLYLGVFLYPLLSYFSYFGVFILAYMCLVLIVCWIKDRKFPVTILNSIILLTAGYVTFEYRLFRAMLLDKTVTIRSTMVRNDLPLLQALKSGVTEFVNASFHNQDSHGKFILYIVILAVAIININYIRNRSFKKKICEPLNLVFGAIVLNSFIFGFCRFKPFINLLETLVHPLKGFDFSRAVFLNPFLWYAALGLTGIKLIDSKKQLYKYMAYGISIIGLLVVMLTPQVYNDFYNTVYNQAYILIKNKETSTVNYREFYSESLFEKIKEDIAYTGEWSVAYGFHPAVLIYNDIHTLDGYLGMYSQKYKDKWSELEAPAFKGSPSLETYYVEWGARVCLYSGSDENTYAPMRNLELSDKSLNLDMDILKELECRYIFSRVELNNTKKLGIALKGVYEEENSPYTIYVYEVPYYE